jgi:hypothetical protein
MSQAPFAHVILRGKNAKYHHFGEIEVTGKRRLRPSAKAPK